MHYYHSLFLCKVITALLRAGRYINLINFILFIYLNNVKNVICKIEISVSSAAA